MKKSEDNVLAHIIDDIKKTNIQYYLQKDIYNYSEVVATSLKNNKSKTGGDGGCIPDITLNFGYENEPWLVFIENKNDKTKMVKLNELGFINNLKKDGEYAHTTVISKYALNGAYYYAKNTYNDTDINNYLVIGVCGAEDSTKTYTLDIARKSIFKSKIMR